MTGDGSDERTTDDRLRSALRGSADPVFVVRVDDGGAIVAEIANESARLLLGLEGELGQDGAGGDAVLDATCPLAARPIIESLRRAATRSRATRETLMLPAADGDRIAVDLQLEPLPRTGTGGSRVLAVARPTDPTLETATGVSASAVGVLRYERGLGVVFVDEAMLGLLGLAHERALGQGWLDALHADDRARVVEALEVADAPAGVIDLDMRLAADDGRERWAHLRAVADRAAVTELGAVTGGRVGGYVALVEDVTEQRSSSQSAAQLSELVDAVEEWVGMADARGTIVYANAVARRGLGIAEHGEYGALSHDEYGALSHGERGALSHGAAIDPDGLPTGAWTGPIALRTTDGGRVEIAGTVRAHRAPDGSIDHYAFLGRDSTDARSAAQELLRRRRSESALRSIVQSSPLPIFAVDHRGAVQLWNRASEEFFGWTAGEAIGAPPPFVASADELTTLTERVFAGETVRSHEARYARRDGHERDVNVAIAPLRNPAGRVVTAVVVVADVTDQKQAERALRESEVRFRSLVQDSSDLITVIGETERVTYLSPSACRFLGVDPDADFSAPFGELVFPDDLPALREAFERVRSNPGSSQLARFRLRRADGEYRWLEMIATNHLADPAVRGVVTNSRDITERVESESVVRASEERLRALLANISDVISVIGADGSLKYSSPTVEQVFGYKDGEWPEGKSVFDTVHPDDRDRIVELWGGSLETRGAFHPLEVRLMRGDGSWMYAEVVANNLLDDPSVNGIVVTSRDVTERKRADEALRGSESRLRASEARYRAVVDDQTELVCRYLPDATLTFVNRAFAEFFGHGSDELIGRALVDLRPASEHVTLLERLDEFTPGEAVRTQIEREVALDGSLRWYEWTHRAFFDGAGAIVEFQSVGHDVTDQRRAAEFTTHQAEILEEVARGVPLDQSLLTIARTLEDQYPRFSCTIMLLDPEAGLLHVGAAPSLPPRFLEIFDGVHVGASSLTCGAAAHLREPVYVSDVATDDRWAGHANVATKHHVHASWSIPIMSNDGDDVLGTLDVFVPEARLPDDEHRQIFVLLARLASIAIERKAYEERLAHQSVHDPLTGLPNRLLFLDRLGLAIARCRRRQSQVAVAFLDLDRFKNVNDSLGHDAGDELLVEVAHKLASVIRLGDTVARFGGDEFTILCEDLPGVSARAQAIEIAERLLAAVSTPIVVRDAEMFVGASIGIAIGTTGDERPEELLRDADAAMYRAKELGRGRVEVFDETMRTRALAAHATENALHRALERDEFRLFFQPIVGLGDARCVGAEALLRWQHPERGLIAPAEFVPLAEETGLVVQIGWWVLEEAARNAARWQLEHGAPFLVSVNLSGRQLVQPDLAERMAEVIAATGVEPSNLCFEITESVLMDDAEAVIDVIASVRALGVQLAIDDFGTGYSSLGYLKRFPVNAVKIDRSFVSGLATDPGDAAIVSAVIGLAHALGLRVTAEGVETEAQLAALIALECDEAQGYFFSPPQPAPDLRSLIARTRTWRPPGATVMRPAGRRRQRSDPAPPA